MYNLCIHCCSTGKDFMHVWDESVSSCGSQEISSCIIPHFKEIASGAKRLVLYSDACGGQNHNIKVISLWKHIVDFSYKVIDHKYMVSGH